MDYIFFGTCAVVVTLTLCSEWFLIRKLGRSRRHVIGDDLIFQNPEWVVLLLAAAGPVLGVMFAIPLYLGWLRKCDLETGLFLALLASAWPIVLALGTYEIYSTYVALGKYHLTIKRWRKVQTIEVAQVTGVLTFQLASAVRLDNGKLVLLPSLIGINGRLQAELRARILTV